MICSSTCPTEVPLDESSDHDITLGDSIAISSFNTNISIWKRDILIDRQMDNPNTTINPVDFSGKRALKI